MHHANRIRVPSFLELALPRRRVTGTTFFHRSQSALAIVAAGLWRGAAVASCSTGSILRRHWAAIVSARSFSPARRVTASLIRPRSWKWLVVQNRSLVKPARWQNDMTTMRS
jgi:hypothetical protein